MKRLKRCVHGKKPTNCGGPCLTAHLEEHNITCSATNAPDGQADGGSTLEKDGTANSTTVAKTESDPSGPEKKGSEDLVDPGKKDEKREDEGLKDGEKSSKDFEDEGETPIAICKPVPQGIEDDMKAAEQADEIDNDNEKAIDANFAKENAEAAKRMFDEIERMSLLPEFTSCRNCNTKPAEGKKVRKCTGCGLVGYCGKQCQEEHWKEAHRSECKFLRQGAKAAIFADRK